jgi:hypothetical protein
MIGRPKTFAEEAVAADGVPNHVSHIFAIDTMQNNGDLLGNLNSK